jgi:hypothetical protein
MRERNSVQSVWGAGGCISTDADLNQALRDAMTKTNVNWGHVRRLCEEIDRQRKQAELVAKRLMGKGKSNPGG